jgi:hypothetical protein
MVQKRRSTAFGKENAPFLEKAQFSDSRVVQLVAAMI